MTEGNQTKKRTGREYTIDIWENPVDQTWSFMVLFHNGRPVNIASGSKIKHGVAAGWRAISAIFWHENPPFPPKGGKS